jgi:hypothetical protein
MLSRVQRVSQITITAVLPYARYQGVFHDRKSKLAQLSVYISFISRNTRERGCNDIGLYETSPIASDIL